MPRLSLALPLTLAFTGCSTEIETSVEQSALTGAIFTTLADGSRVNANIYSAKELVYLDGGPSGNAPSNAAALPEGDYYFQVTAPNGRTLLSTDAIECRGFHVNGDGVIDRVVPGPGGCEHETGIDNDHSELGAITVQLFPYLDTPNQGGEYKVWVTAIANYKPSAMQTHGFVPKDSKTDNFKVVESAPPPPSCGDGHVDDGESCDDGNTAPGDGCSATCVVEPPPPPPPPPAPSCGDGHVDDGEACDDGNATSGDGCSATCEVEHAACCGDGHVDAGEACDDGNTTSGDGCSATCQVEHFCGDGNIDPGEACDDGNATSGDGCSATCQIECVSKAL